MILRIGRFKRYVDVRSRQIIDARRQCRNADMIIGLEEEIFPGGAPNDSCGSEIKAEIHNLCFCGPPQEHALLTSSYHQAREIAMA